MLTSLSKYVPCMRAYQARLLSMLGAVRDSVRSATEYATHILGFGSRSNGDPREARMDGGDHPAEAAATPQPGQPGQPGQEIRHRSKRTKAMRRQAKARALARSRLPGADALFAQAHG